MGCGVGKRESVRDGWVEAECCVGVERVQRRPAPVPVVCEFRVRSICGEATRLPMREVLVRDVLVGVCVVRVVEKGGELAEGFDPDDAFEREVGLEGKPAGEVVGAD